MQGVELRPGGLQPLHQPPDLHVRVLGMSRRALLGLGLLERLGHLGLGGLEQLGRFGPRARQLLTDGWTNRVDLLLLPDDGLLPCSEACICVEDHPLPAVSAFDFSFASTSRSVIRFAHEWSSAQPRSSS
ncbi:hypothetical protein E2562_019884 [Oryza meyeriana var. granulata]|uniref:Uncharacterized protein n=1 Tax=Oryza meyeriana var. granulata TaxID=110450 RepID=A0A6G1EXH2_9ORYZ|nr:hypothetical protein E2562_019884 [Oryza meyeriana var. granulata]